MIKRVQIMELWPKNKTTEYLIVSAEDSTDEEYYNLAWKCALKQFFMDPDCKSHHKFTVSDYMA